jgi:hypothetical protein
MKGRQVHHIFIILLVFVLTACASGSSIVTGDKRQPLDPGQVKLYLDPPAKYEVIGIVKASSDSGWTGTGIAELCD